MTAEAGERFAGPGGARGARGAWSPSCARPGPDRAAEEPYRARRAVLAPLGRAHRAARSRCSGSCAWTSSRAPAIDAVHDGPRAHPPGGWRQVYLDWLENIRPWCISRQLWWGHQLPVWYRGDGDLRRRPTPPEGEGWERDPDVLDTWFSLGAVAVRDARLARRHARAARLLPDRRALDGARHPLPLGRADDHDGARVRRRRPVRGRLHPLGDPGARRAADVEVAGHRRSTRSDEIERHGADAVRFGLLAMSSTQDVRYSAEKVEQGEALANKLWNASRLILLGVDPTTRGAEPRPRTVEDRWILARLRARARQTLERVDGFDFSPRRARALRLRLRRAVRLVPGARQAAARTSGDPRRCSRDRCCYVLRETLALAHPVIPFVTEEIWSLPARAPRACSPARRFAEPDDSLRDPARRGGGAAR